MCPSSGRMRRDIARRTAFSEPGSEKSRSSDRPRTGPAEHRRRTDFREAEGAEQLAEAVDPLVQHPGDRFVGAVARGRSPSRPSRSPRPHCRPRSRTTSRTISGSPVPAFVRPGVSGLFSASTMASPLVSVASVRVSLTVRTKRRSTQAHRGGGRTRSRPDYSVGIADRGASARGLRLCRCAI